MEGKYSLTSQPRWNLEPKLVCAMSKSGSGHVVAGMKWDVANDVSVDDEEQKVPKTVLGVPDSEINVYPVNCTPTKEKPVGLDRIS